MGSDSSEGNRTAAKPSKDSRSRAELLQRIAELEGERDDLHAVIRGQELELAPLRDRASLAEDQVALNEILRERLLKVEEIARLDHLTGLHNRRVYDQARQRVESSNVLLGGDRRRHEEFLVIDLDHFKGYNDTAGHPAGDAALERVGVILLDLFGANAFRIGGDEFAALAPPGEAQALARAILERWPLDEFTYRNAKTGEQVIVTVSIGVGSTHAEADQMMYQAKRSKGAERQD